MSNYVSCSSELLLTKVIFKKAEHLMLPVAVICTQIHYDGSVLIARDETRVENTAVHTLIKTQESKNRVLHYFNDKW